MINWEQHFHLSGEKCFEMFFLNYNSIIRFRVISSDSLGTRKARNCTTGHNFEFNRNELYKLEYETLIEIDCKKCKK